LGLVDERTEGWDVVFGVDRAEVHLE
jgi:hypothetical protein